jgi:carbon monoxide dehydrogenase subunit G
MFETRNSIFIKRPLQDVFNLITDPAKTSFWQSMTESAEWSSNGSHGVGSTQRVVARFLGRKIESEIEVTAWEPPHRIDWKFVNGPYPAEVSNTLEPQGEGTLLTSQSQGEMGSFFKLAEGLVARQLEKQLDANFETLKLLMESNQA